MLRRSRGGDAYRKQTSMPQDREGAAVRAGLHGITANTNTLPTIDSSHPRWPCFQRVSARDPHVLASPGQCGASVISWTVVRTCARGLEQHGTHVVERGEKLGLPLIRRAWAAWPSGRRPSETSADALVSPGRRDQRGGSAIDPAAECDKRLLDARQRGRKIRSLASIARCFGEFLRRRR